MHSVFVVLAGVPGPFSPCAAIAEKWPEWEFVDLQGGVVEMGTMATVIAAVPADRRVLVVFSAAVIRLQLAVMLLPFLRDNGRRHFSFVLARMDTADEPWIREFLDEIRKWGGFVSVAHPDEPDLQAATLVGTITAAME